MDENLSHHRCGYTCYNNEPCIFGFLPTFIKAFWIFEKRIIRPLYKQDRLDQLTEDKKFLKRRVVSKFSENYLTTTERKENLREDYQPKINDINTTMMELKQEIGDLKTGLVETGVDVAHFSSEYLILMWIRL